MSFFNKLIDDLKAILPSMLSDSFQMISTIASYNHAGMYTQVGLQAIPFIINLYSLYEQKKQIENIRVLISELERRADKFDGKLLVFPSGDRKFIEEKALPIMLSSSLREDEHEKINYIVNGMETILDRQVDSYSMVLAYYDILSSTRINELNYLLEIYKTNNKLSEPKGNIEASRIDNVEQGYVRYVINKLKQMGLIIIEDTWESMSSEVEYQPEQIKITTFGEAFIDFFKSKEL